MSAAPVEGVEVGDLDPAGVLDLAGVNEREIRERELRRLELAYRWAVLHPVTAETGVDTHGGPALEVLSVEESLGGEGTPAVAAFSAESFAAALGLSPAAGASLIGDALDLRVRLPLLWGRVVGLVVPAWQARRVAQQTRRLPYAGARWVDEQLAGRTGCGPVIVDRLVAEAIARFDPEVQEEREENAQAGWEVSLCHPEATEFVGTSHLQASGDTVTLEAFHDLVCAIAHRLLVEGDTSPLGVRKITAVAIIVALATGAGAPTGSPAGSGSPEVSSALAAAARRPAGRVRVYVRVDAQDLDLDGEGGSGFAAGQVERLGAATLARIRRWVGHHRVEIRPVLNMRRGDPVDVHDPPQWMRELVILRDGHCVFPGCRRDARSCDIDHIEAYLPPDEGGPPGQTHPENLACLCRRHHRAKTAGLWRYQRTPTGNYHWHGPYRRSYLVTPDGTHRLPG